MSSSGSFVTSCMPKPIGCKTWFADDEALNLLAKQYDLCNDDYYEIDFYIGVRAIVIGFSQLSVQGWRQHLQATKPSQISNCIVEAYYMYRGGVDVVRDEIKSKFAPRRIDTIPTTSVYLYTQRKLLTMFNTKINSGLTLLLVCKLYAHKTVSFEQDCFDKHFGPKTFHGICQLCKDNDHLAHFAKYLKIEFPDALKNIFPGSGSIPVLYVHVQPPTSEEDVITTLKNCELRIIECANEIKDTRRKLKNSPIASRDDTKRKYSNESDKCSSGKRTRRRIVSSEDEDSSTSNNADVQVLKEFKSKISSAQLARKTKRNRSLKRSSFIIDEAEETDDEEEQDEDDEEELNEEEVSGEEENEIEDEDSVDTEEDEETDEDVKSEEEKETEKEEI